MPPASQPRLPPLRLLAVAVFGLALLMSLGIAGATRPPSIFTKYLAAATSPGARALDYSPLYLAFAKATAPRWGAGLMLWLQCVMHASACAAIALAVGTLSGRAAGVAAGAMAATYRPFLAYAGVLEPEIPLVLVLAVACGCGIVAFTGRLGRKKLEAGGRVAFALAAGGALGLAGLLRPQYVILLPVWSIWVASGAPRLLGRWLSVAVLVPALLVIGAHWIARDRGERSTAGMNAGTNFYDGNNPAAAAGPPTPASPDLVKMIELATNAPSDLSHVVYRRIADAVEGRPLTSRESNRFWSGLAFEWIRARPGRALRRIGKKLIGAFSPCELHDLQAGVQMDSRVSARIPWGFGLLWIGLPGLAALPRSRVRELAGPLALALLALFVQMVFYVSARQRMPFALALLIIVPVALGELLKAKRPVVLGSLGAGMLVLIAITAVSGGWAAEQNATFLNEVRAAAGGSDLRVAAILDGRTFHRSIGEALDRLKQGQRLYRIGRWDEAYQSLAPVADGQLVGNRRFRSRANYWMARCELARRRVDSARALAKTAFSLEPDDLRGQALATVLSGIGPETAMNWRPPGYDELSARIALARELSFTGHRELARRVAFPVAEYFPEMRGVSWP